MDIVWSKHADTRIDEIFEYILNDNPHAALQICRCIEERVSNLLHFPYSGRIGRLENTRELVVAGLPYIVVYQIIDEIIYILTVRHTSQEWPETFDT